MTSSSICFLIFYRVLAGTTTIAETTPTITTAGSTAVSTTVAPTSPTPGGPVTCSCHATDGFDTPWQAERNTTAYKPCSHVIANADGTASWDCTSDCRFATESPDFSTCRVKEIVDIDQAVTMNSLVHNSALGWTKI